ncbi:MAG TPA: glycogen debranching enzyme, partial [Acidothermaceae bacterium]|nr:glycogen debranching enzyme [Acidothermaceae bacterium]
ATLGEFASRLTGSSDLYANSGRRPMASVNFVTAHDGFTLQDLVSYNNKHNEENGEDGHDGTDDNRSWNCGAEGPTDDVEIMALREQQKRNFLTTLLVSQGVPMLLYGDEFGRTQEGNNNAYCQDNDTSWVDWSLGAHHDVQLKFTQSLARLRRDHPVFRRRRFFDGKPAHIRGEALRDIEWFTPAGVEMTESDWETGYARSMGVFLNGGGIGDPDPRGQAVVDDSFLLLFNAADSAIEFTLPSSEYGERWEIAVDTSSPLAIDRPSLKAEGTVGVEARSVLVLRRAV